MFQVTCVCARTYNQYRKTFAAATATEALKIAYAALARETGDYYVSAVERIS